MNNSLLPLLSSSQFKSFGSDEMMNLDTNPMRMDNIISFYDSSFYFNTGVCNNDYQFSDEIYNALPFPPQIKYYQPGVDYLPNASYIPQQPSSFSNKIHITHQVELKSPTNSRKRSVEIGTQLTKNNKKICSGDKNKRKNIIQVNESEAKEIFDGNIVPVKRSQRLSDKITAIQKLVSPYGKTDTASVLEEASISIKLLQDQINDLFHGRNNLYMIYNQTLHLQKNKGNEVDLCERGLCLIPLSVTREFTKQDH